MSGKQTSINRRDFLSTAIVGAGAGLVIGAPSLLSAAAKGPDRSNVALVGMGKQGGALLNGNRICGQIVNANAQWNRSTPFSPPSGPAQRQLQGPPVRSKLLAASDRFFD